MADTYGAKAPYGELYYKGDAPPEEEELRHYPALLDLGNYTKLFNIGNGYGDQS